MSDSTPEAEQFRLSREQKYVSEGWTTKDADGQQTEHTMHGDGSVTSEPVESGEFKPVFEDEPEDAPATQADLAALRDRMILGLGNLQEAVQNEITRQKKTEQTVDIKEALESMLTPGQARVLAVLEQTARILASVRATTPISKSALATPELLAATEFVLDKAAERDNTVPGGPNMRVMAAGELPPEIRDFFMQQFAQQEQVDSDGHTKDGSTVLEEDGTVWHYCQANQMSDGTRLKDWIVVGNPLIVDGVVTATVRHAIDGGEGERQWAEDQDVLMLCEPCTEVRNA